MMPDMRDTFHEEYQKEWDACAREDKGTPMTNDLDEEQARVFAAYKPTDLARELAGEVIEAVINPNTDDYDEMQEAVFLAFSLIHAEATQAANEAAAKVAQSDEERAREIVSWHHDSAPLLVKDLVRAFASIRAMTATTIATVKPDIPLATVGGLETSLPSTEGNTDSALTRTATQAEGESMNAATGYIDYVKTHSQGLAVLVVFPGQEMPYPTEWNASKVRIVPASPQPPAAQAEGTGLIHDLVARGVKFDDGDANICAGKMAAPQPPASGEGGMREALEFYADPDTYCAIGFFPDPPCGEFIDDFSDDHGNENYRRPMPGKRARAALAHDGERGMEG